MEIEKDFKLYTKDKKLKVNTSEYLSNVENFVTPTIVEERSMGNRAIEMNVFSRLLMERIIFLSGEVNSTSMDTIVGQLLYLDSVDNRPISLYINSVGGECYSGLELVSTMDFIKSDVQTIVLGMAASMGAVIASNGTKGSRFALPYSRYMIHQPSSNFGYNTFKDSEIALKEMNSVRHDLYEILAKNSGKTIDEIEVLCDRDRWMRSTEAIEMGFIDKIIEHK